MTTMTLSVGEPYTSPAWGSNFVVFSNDSGLAVPEEDAKEYIGKSCRYAQKYGVYLVPERFMLMGYQCLCLISPEGKVIGAQKCLFWNTARRTGKRSSTLEVFNTEFGGIFLCVDVDIYHPEVVRVASSMGAKIIICSQQIERKDWGGHMVVTGAWNAAQSNPVYTVGVCNQYNCVSAPRPLTAHNDGFIVPPNNKMPLTAKLSADKLEALPPRFCLSRKLYAIHREELIG